MQSFDIRVTHKVGDLGFTGMSAPGIKSKADILKRYLSSSTSDANGKALERERGRAKSTGTCSHQHFNDKTSTSSQLGFTC